MRAIAAPLLFSALWSLFAPIYNLPGIVQIGDAFGEMVQQGTYFRDIMVSSIRGLSGFFIGFLAGGLIGVLTGYFSGAYLVLGGLLLFLRWTPVLALLPLTLRIGGLGEAPKIFLITWACFFISWAYTHVAVTRLSRSYGWWSDSLGLGRLRRLWFIYTPAISPTLIGAARVALSVALIVVVAAELGGTTQQGFFRGGLGYRISRAIETGRNDINIACILTFGAIGIIYDWLLMLAIRHILIPVTKIDFLRTSE